jgi:oxygen-independent coproporphyrinogen-3 oxidase
MKEHGVTRISINPQTMNTETLHIIGRNHTPEQFIRSFELARKHGFDNINTDIIAGLPMEKLRNMEKTLSILKKLRPESLTVHSLAVKRAAHLKEELTTYQEYINHDAKEMQIMAADYAKHMGMKPYYMYRQKNIAGNLENVGYAKPGFESAYNVMMMDDSQTILGIGAGASTKVLGGKRGIERLTECKYPYDYLERFDELMAEKEKQIRALLSGTAVPPADL